MNTFTAIDLFCGAGGVSQALKQKFNILCAVEFNPIIAKTYSLNHSDKHLLIEDIRNISKETWLQFTKIKQKYLDLLVVTPPCQGFSKHSRKKTIESHDVRNKLIMQTIRVSNIFHPKYIFFENVGNIVNYKIFHHFLRGLINLNQDGTPKIKSRPSYHIRFEVVEASDYDVPQKRRRLILLGKRIDSFPCPDAVLIDNEPCPKVKVPLDIWPTKKPSKTLGEYLSQYNLKAIEAGQFDQDDPLHAAAGLSELNIKRLKATPINGGSRDAWPEELHLECHKKKNVSFSDVYGRMNFAAYAPTITCGCIIYSKGRFGHPEQNRAISLREAALIQTFPIDYKFTGSIKGEPNLGSKGQIAVQIGNAVPVNLAKAFINEIVKCLEKTSVQTEENNIHHVIMY